MSLFPSIVSNTHNSYARRGILHDPEEYPSPESFNPERFLTKLPDGTWGYNTIVRDPTVACFGFGRRMCPGRHLSEQSIWAVASHVLATCSLTPPLDAEGKPVYPKVEMTAGSALSWVHFCWDRITRH